MPAMKSVLGEVMREFYEFGIPEDVMRRDVDNLQRRENFPH